MHGKLEQPTRANRQAKARSARRRQSRPKMVRWPSRLQVTLIPNPQSPIPGLYVHVPFCSSICNYCNFNRGLFDETLKTRFVEALFDARSGHVSPDPFPLRPDTLYFGGGTPSLLTPAEVASIIDESRRSLGLTADAEITLEANPETVTAHDAGTISRRGCQSSELRHPVISRRRAEAARRGCIRPERAHRGRRDGARGRVRQRQHRPDDVAARSGRGAVARIGGHGDRASNPDHLSLYILEVYPHLPLKQEIDRHGWTQLPDDGAAEMYETAMARLDAAGYEQYEISNVCRPGPESRHNVKYWTDGDWLGFGPGAHSTWDGVRWRNVTSTEEYANRIDEGRSADVDRRVLTDGRATRRRAVYGPAPESRRRHRTPVDAVWHRRLGPVRRPARAISGRGHPVETGCAPAADPAGDAIGQRSNVGLRLDLSL